MLDHPAADESAASSVSAQVAVRRWVLVRAAALYFLIVFATGLALGPLRVIYLEPWLGRTLAVLIESPLLIAAMAFAARWVPGWTKLEPTRAALLLMGLIALALQQIADLAVGFGLRGMTLNEQLLLFTTPAGWIYLFDLVAFALAPVIMRRADRAG